jgi:putative zinc finger protein
VVIHCRKVWREISNYLEGDLSPEMRRDLEEHFANCRNCTALLDGTRNVLLLIADDRVLPLPIGFSARLRKRLENTLKAQKK